MIDSCCKHRTYIKGFIYIYMSIANFLSDFTDSKVLLTTFTINKHLFTLLNISRHAQVDIKSLKLFQFKKIIIKILE